jgi:hypothetical protein
MYGTHTQSRITGPSRRAILPRMGAYTRNIRRPPLGAYTAKLTRQTGLGSLGQVDMSSWPVDASTGDVIDPSTGNIYLDPGSMTPVSASQISGQTGISTSYSTTVSTGVPTGNASGPATGTVSSNPISDFFSAITGAATAATAVYNAADLIKINQQRAAQGLLPINAAGQLATTTTTAGLFASPMVWVIGLAAVFLLTRK